LAEGGGVVRKLSERGCALSLIFVGRVDATSKLGERECELTLNFVGRVGAAIEVGESKFELELFSLGREIALEFERCEGEGPL